ncbi:MAG: hypothetical protein IKT78_02960 [Ruminiclostridium sp.]|nr:hypothetical protein [Ruminiclostridium sp.]
MTTASELRKEYEKKLISYITGYQAEVKKSVSEVMRMPLVKTMLKDIKKKKLPIEHITLKRKETLITYIDGTEKLQVKMEHPPLFTMKELYAFALVITDKFESKKAHYEFSVENFYDGGYSAVDSKFLEYREEAKELCGWSEVANLSDFPPAYPDKLPTIIGESIQLICVKDSQELLPVIDISLVNQE